MTVVDLVTRKPVTRTVIHSQRRAMEIVERIVAKHELTVSVALCARWDRYARDCRAEIAWTLRDELRWSTRRSGSLLGCSARNVCDLLTSHEIALRRAKNILPAADLRALAEISKDDLRQRVADVEADNAMLRAEIERLTGASLTHRLARLFGLENKLRCAIVLAIVVEAYPRHVTSMDIVELYDEACDRLNYGARNGATANLITKNIAALRDHVATLGMADPIESFEAHSGLARRLSDAAAEYLHVEVGAPRLSQLKADARSRQLQRVMAR